MVTMYVVTKADTKLSKMMPTIRGTGKTRKTGSRDQTISVVTPRNARGISIKRNDRNKPTRDPITIPRIILAMMADESMKQRRATAFLLLP